MTSRREHGQKEKHATLQKGGGWTNETWLRAHFSPLVIIPSILRRSRWQVWSREIMCPVGIIATMLRTKPPLCFHSTL